jgi:hypothetical protein
MPESPTEWMASANMEDDSVRMNATNFKTAMVRLAARAATIALVPPVAAKRPALGGAALVASRRHKKP